MTWFRLPLAGTGYTVRTRAGYVTGATSEHGIDVRPEELYRLAREHGVGELERAIEWERNEWLASRDVELGQAERDEHEETERAA